MPKKHRLTGAQIRRLRPEKRLISSLFSLSASKSDSEVGQFACVVSKKVSAKAVVRNTVKRRMRAGLQTVSLPSRTSLILVAKKSAGAATLTEIRTDIEQLIGKLRSEK